MPKIKIKDYKGIFTNLDENDSSIETVRDSINFAHKRGFLEFVPRHLAERMDMPDLTDYGYPVANWTYETGIYTTLTSDRLTTATDAVPTSYNVFVVISKMVIGSDIHRVISLHDGSGWTNLERYNSPKVNGVEVIDIINFKTGIGFESSMFSTQLEGTPFFQVEDGRLKVYLPHASFWIGRIERKIWLTDHAERWPYTDPGTGNVTYPYFNYEAGYWYIDRLTDYWNYNKQYVWFPETSAGENVPDVPTNYDPYFFRCARTNWGGDGYAGRRMAIHYDVDIDTNQTHTVGGVSVNVGGPHDNKLRIDPYDGNSCWCTRSTITNTETGVGVTCPWKPFESVPSIWTIPIDTAHTSLGWDYLDPDDININSGQYHDIYLVFTPKLQSLFKKNDDDAWTWATSGWASYTNLTVVKPNGIVRFLGTSYSVPYYDYLNFDWEYLGDAQIADVGYTKDEDKFGIVATLVLDDREELPVKAQTFSYDVTGSNKFAVKITNIDIPLDVNKRVTRLRFYHCVKDASDLEMVKEFDFLNSDGVLKDFAFTDEQKSGDTLAANMGYLWNLWELPNDLQILQGFRGFVTESGISIGLATKDAVSIYHSTFGGGHLMSDLVFDDNRIPISGIAKLTAVGNADGRLMAFTDNTAYAIEAEEVSGVIGFRIEDTVEVGVKNQQDIANIQGGIAVHTRHGIYVTNGYETKSISEPIDDIIVQYYNTGRIYYNRYKHFLYYKPTNAEDLYRYRFVDNVWERINKTTTEAEVEEEVAD